MENVVLKKINGEVMEINLNKQVSSKPYLVNGERCFEQLIDYSKTSKIDKTVLKTLKKSLYTVIEDLSKSPQGKYLINHYMNQLKTVQTRIDLKNILLKLIEDYKKIILMGENKYIKCPYSPEISCIETTMDTNFDLAISTFIKKLVSIYFENIILNLDNDTLNKLEYLKLKGYSFEQVIFNICEQFNQTFYDNGVYELSKRIFYDVLDNIYERKQTHLCWEGCKNAHPLQCKKITDRIKSRISEYEFITDGYQEIDKAGNIDKFIVSGCKNYEKESEKILTIEQKERAKKAKEALMLHYFDAETIEEAWVIQHDLLVRGELTSGRGKTIPLERIKEFKQKIK